MTPKSSKKSPARKPARSKTPQKVLHGEVLPRQEADENEIESSDESSDESSGESSDDEEPTDVELSDEAGARDVVLPGKLPERLEDEYEGDSSSRALSSSDPLGRYLLEVRRHPLLTHEEEASLLKRLREHGDIEAARALVSANLRLVVKIAFEYRSVYANAMDLIQEGNIGLMKAVSKFDPTKGAKLSYYASWWIRSYILKYLLDNFRLVKVGTTQAQKKLFYHLMREKERLEAQGLIAGPKLLAEKLHVREKDVVAMQQRLSSSGAEVSVDSPVGDPSGEGRVRTLGDQLESGAESPDHAIEREQLLGLLRARLPDFKALLNQREARLLEDRLLAEEPKTLQEVADLYGLTRERARQIEAKLIDKLREFLAKDLGT